MHCRLLGRPGPHRRRCSASSTTSQQHDRVWVCRRIDIARHWKQTHPYPARLTMALTLEQLNAASRRRSRRAARRPVRALALDREARAGARARSARSPHLKHAMAQVVRRRRRERAAGPDPRPPRARRQGDGRARALTAESTNEQSKAGLTDCTPEEFAQIQQLNADYNAKFGFPFILAVRGPRGTGLRATARSSTPSSAGWTIRRTSSWPSACATSTASPSCA